MIGQKNVHADRTCFMEIEQYNLEDWLGTNSLDPDIHARHVLDKVTDEAARQRELDSLPKEEAMEQVEKKGMTVFYRRPEDKVLYIKNHMIKGFLKASGDALRVEANKETTRTKPEEGAEKPKGKGTIWGSIDGKIDDNITVYPNELVICDVDGKPKLDGDGFLVRSLRAQTLQGPRVTVVKSEILSPLSRIRYTLFWPSNGPVNKDMLVKMLDRGEIYFGLGQWRSSGKGKFTYRILAEGIGVPPSSAKAQLEKKLAASKK